MCKTARLEFLSIASPLWRKLEASVVPSHGIVTVDCCTMAGESCAGSQAELFLTPIEFLCRYQ